MSTDEITIMDSPFSFAPAQPDGRFHYLLEYRLPAFSVSPAQAHDTVAEEMQQLAGITGIDAILVDDRPDGYPGYCHDELLPLLGGGSGRRVIVTVSGKSASPEQLRGRMEFLREQGISEILAVSGDLPHREFAGREGAFSYVGSTAIIRMAAEMGLCAGAAYNPYQYTRPMMILQQAKLMKKLACGAGFLALQGGWDMKKIQELEWLMREREIAVPVFPRITWLKAQEVAEPKRALPAGCLAPELLMRQMAEEVRAGEEQFQGAQLRRLALQIAGCRRCGCSGVLLRGFEGCIPVLQQVLEAAEQVAAQCPDFDSWLEVWEREMAEYILPPALIQEYLYRHLMEPLKGEAPVFKPEVFRTEIPCCTWRERLSARLLRHAARPETGEWLRNMITRFYGVDAGGLGALEECMWLSNAACPRGLCDGVCGNADPDGNCDADSSKACFFRQVLAMAVATERVHCLEGRNPGNSPETER